MSRTAWYIDWFNSPYYYHLYIERNEKEAAEFVQNLVLYLHPAPGCRMLDVACGRGRHSKVLASMGFDVTGTDISTTAITYAQQFEKENLQFYVHDMRLPFWINYFDFVFNFFTSFGYFRTKREHEDAIRTICNSLKENGTLVFDFLNVHYCEKKLVSEETKKINNVSYDIRRWDDDTHFYKKIIIHDPALKQSKTFTEEVTKFSLKDFTAMLKVQNMQVVSVFGDYQLCAYNNETSPRMIIIAKKINPSYYS